MSLEDGLIAKYDLDTNANDSVGSNDGTLVGSPTFATGEGRTALDVNGTSQYASIPYSADLVPANITVSTWVKFDVLDDTYDSIVWQNGSSESEYSSYALRRYRSGLSAPYTNVMAFYVNTTSGHLPNGVISDQPAEANRWYHLVGTYDGATAKLYVDGVFNSSEALTGDIKQYSGSSLDFGRNSIWSDQNLDGKVDDTRIWNRALSASEVTELHVGPFYQHPEDDTSLDPVSSSSGWATVGPNNIGGGNFAWYTIDPGDDGYLVASPVTPYAVNLEQTKTYNMPFSHNYARVKFSYYYIHDVPSVNLYADGQLVYTVSAEDRQATSISGSPFSWSNQFVADIDIIFPHSASTLDLKVVAGPASGHRRAAFSPVELYLDNSEYATGGYDWSLGGQLTDIVSITSGFDAAGSHSNFLLKAESDRSTTFYSTGNLNDFAAFKERKKDVTAIHGIGKAAAFGSPGVVCLGTSTGKLYEVPIAAGSEPGVPNMLFENPNGKPISVIHHGKTAGEWIFATDGGIVKTIPQGGGSFIDRLDLNTLVSPGAIVVDIAEAPDGFVVVFKRLDSTFDLIIVSSDWITVSVGAKIKAILEDNIELNYNYKIDTWVASTADGAIVATDDLANWLETGSSMWIAVGGNGLLAHSPDGVTWTYDPISNLINVGNNMGEGLAYGESADGSTQAWVMANKFTALEISTDADPSDGGGWTNFNIPGYNAARDVSWSSGTRTFIACGDSTSIMRSTDLGASWNTVAIGAIGSEDFQKITNNGAEIWLMARFNGIWRSSDDGLTWALIHSLPSAVGDLAYNNGVWIAFNEAEIYRSDDDGNTWSAATFNNNSPAGHVWRGAASGGTIIGVGVWGNMWKSTDAGLTFDRVSNAMSNSMYDIATDGDTWVACGNGAQIQTSTDNGVTWTLTADVIWGTTHTVKSIIGNGNI